MTTILQPGDYTVPPPLPPITRLVGLQNAPFELLWGVGRSNPVQNPALHGTASWAQGEPSTLTFKPIKLPNDRDNLYCVRRLGLSLNQSSVAAATSLTESQTLQVDVLANVEAIETDWHIQAGTLIWNPGLQLLPSGVVRGWQNTAKDWVDLTVRFSPQLLLSGLTLAAEYKMTTQSLIHVAVTINGQRTPVSLTQPVVTAPVAGFVFNKAVQTDANGAAAPYVLKVGQMQVSWQ